MIGHLQELKGESNTSIDTVGTSRDEAIYSCPKNVHMSNDQAICAI